MQFYWFKYVVMLYNGIVRFNSETLYNNGISDTLYSNGISDEFYNNGIVMFNSETLL
jgi:hypothetical protein